MNRAWTTFAVTVMLNAGLVASSLAGKDWFDGTTKPKAEAKASRSPILDAPTEPVYQFTLGFIAERDFESHGASAVLEPAVDWELSYFRGIAGGDMDLRLRVLGILFLDNTELALPDQLAKVAIDTAWTRRMKENLALQLRLLPGLYSDLEGFGMDNLYIPFSASLISVIHPRLSGQIGLEVRPGFDQSIMPLVGLVWEAGDGVRLDARLPRSRLTVNLDRDWDWYMGFVWNNTSFTLNDDRDQITVEDFRAFTGLTYRITDQIQFSGELGEVFGRNVEFEERSNGVMDSDVDSGLLVKFGLGGPF